MTKKLGSHLSIVFKKRAKYDKIFVPNCSEYTWFINARSMHYNLHKLVSELNALAFNNMNVKMNISLQGNREALLSTFEVNVYINSDYVEKRICKN